LRRHCDVAIGWFVRRKKSLKLFREFGANFDFAMFAATFLALAILPRAIILDADGTLLNRAHRLTPTVERAVRSAQEAGVLVVPATGRARAGPWVEEVLDPLFDCSPRGVFLQGLIVCDGATCILDSRLAPQIGARVVGACIGPSPALVAAYCNEKLYYPAGFEGDERIEVL